MVLQWDEEHWVGVRPWSGGGGAERPTALGSPTEFFLLFLAHSPAWAHLWAVSDRWSKQKVDLQESQRKGRKSSWRQ